MVKLFTVNNSYLPLLKLFTVNGYHLLLMEKPLTIIIQNH